MLENSGARQIEYQSSSMDNMKEEVMIKEEASPQNMADQMPQGVDVPVIRQEDEEEKKEDQYKFDDDHDNEQLISQEQADRIYQRLSSNK